MTDPRTKLSPLHMTDTRTMLSPSHDSDTCTKLFPSHDSDTRTSCPCHMTLILVKSCPCHTTDRVIRATRLMQCRPCHKADATEKYTKAVLPDEHEAAVPANSFLECRPTAPSHLKLPPPTGSQHHAVFHINPPRHTPLDINRPQHHAPLSITPPTPHNIIRH